MVSFVAFVCVKFHIYYAKMIFKFTINLWKIWMKCFGVINGCLCFLWNIWVILIPLYLQHVQRLYLCFLWKLAHGSVLFYALLCFHENLIIIFWLDHMHMSLQFNWNMQIFFFVSLIVSCTIIYCRCWTTMCLEVGLDLYSFLKFITEYLVHV
jgi:hypothetical protein